MKWIILSLAALASAADGQTVYKSVGADGTVVYSDEPVANNVLVETLEFENRVDTQQAAEAAAAQIEQMSQTTERLKQDRQDREQTRLAEEELELIRQQQQTPPLIYREDYYSSHYPYYHHRPYRPKLVRHHKQRNLNNPAVLTPRSKPLTPNIPRDRSSSYHQKNSRTDDRRGR